MNGHKVNNDHKVNDVAGFTAVGSGGSFIRGELYRVEYITKKLIPLREKKRKALSATHSSGIFSAYSMAISRCLLSELRPQDALCFQNEYSDVVWQQTLL